MLSSSIVYFYALALLALSAYALPIILGKLKNRAKCLDNTDDCDL
jgi:hypothetical protein